MILALCAFAAAADLTLRLVPPGGTATTVVIHDVHQGALPTFELPQGDGTALRLAVSLTEVPGGAVLGLAFDHTRVGSDSKLRVEPGQAHTLSVGMNNHTNVTWGHAVPVQEADGSWGYEDRLSTVSASLSDGSVPEVSLPAERRLDLVITGPDHAPVAFSVENPVAENLPIVEIATGKHTVRRVALSLVPAPAQSTTFVFVVDNAKRRGKVLVPVRSWTPSLTIKAGDRGFAAHGGVRRHGGGAAMEESLVRVDVALVEPGEAERVGAAPG